MKKVKITVLRATFNEDLALEYGMPGLKPCSCLLYTSDAADD